MRRAYLAVIAAVVGVVIGVSLAMYTARHVDRAKLLLTWLCDDKYTVRVWVDGLERPGGELPVNITCDYPAAKPPFIHWEPSRVPGAKTWAIIVFDPDAPGGTFIHLVAFDIPMGRSSWPTPQAGVIARNSGGVQGWFPVCPPPGEKHRYYFLVLALNETVNLSQEATPLQVLEYIHGHVVACGYTWGIYARRAK